MVQDQKPYPKIMDLVLDLGNNMMVVDPEARIDFCPVAGEGNDPFWLLTKQCIPSYRSRFVSLLAAE